MWTGINIKKRDGVDSDSEIGPNKMNARQKTKRQKGADLEPMYQSTIYWKRKTSSALMIDKPFWGRIGSYFDSIRKLNFF